MAKAVLTIGAALAGVVAAGSSAFAQDAAVRTARESIVRGDLVAAERVLIAEQRVFPRNAEVLVNLAAVYAADGRVSEASALYRRILANDAVLLDISDDRTASSHKIANLGLQRLARLQTAAR